MLLNCTTRKAVEKVVPKLFAKYPDAESMSTSDFDELSQMIAPLGFRNRRARNIIEMSKYYLRPTWKHASELPGIGDYASAAWEIFVLGKMPADCPKDHALTMYYKWRVKHGY
jgi:endonuclease III